MDGFKYSLGLAKNAATSAFFLDAVGVMRLRQASSAPPPSLCPAGCGSLSHDRLAPGGSLRGPKIFQTCRPKVRGLWICARPGRALRMPAQVPRRVRKNHPSHDGARSRLRIKRTARLLARCQIKLDRKHTVSTVMSEARWWRVEIWAWMQVRCFWDAHRRGAGHGVMPCLRGKKYR